MIIPVISVNGEYHASQKTSEPLKDMIIEQKESLTKPQLQSVNTRLLQDRNQKMKDMAGQIRKFIPPRKQRLRGGRGGGCDKSDWRGKGHSCMAKCPQIY